MKNSKICVVLLSNDGFFNKMVSTLSGLKRTDYDGDICLVIGDDLVNSDKLKNPILENVVIKHFPDIKFSEEFMNKFYTINRDGLWRNKFFQYHKLNLFHEWFKQWEYIFYIDSGAVIYSSIYPIINSKKEKKFLAHSDTYHTYEWRLFNQFDTGDDSFHKIKENYNFNVDYPQTTIMLYDTDIITNNTFNDLINLCEEVKCSITNDQGILALFFTNINNCWEQIRLEDDNFWYYDYLLRPFKHNKPHIILKRP
jgi:hypothetical protein